MGVIKGVIGIKDNMTAVLRSIKQEQAAFRTDVQKTKREIQNTWNKKHEARLESGTATKKAAQLRQSLEPLRKKVVATVSVKDAAADQVKSITGKLKTVGKFVASPVVKLKDLATSGVKKAAGALKSIGKSTATATVKLKDMVSTGISSIGSKLKSLAKNVVIPVTVAATVVTAGITAAVNSGMQLENQQVSMSHFIQATNKGMSQADVKRVTDGYIAQLRDNANKTPFETGEVIGAGSRAVAISGGNTKEAMSLVTLAEDMAAASGGTKTVSDAIEALADAKLGEMERLKEFGFKVSKEQFDAKGFAGVSNDLKDFYGGAAEKLATTGSGLLSTIKGKLKSNIADFGLQVVDKLKPAFESVITLVDKLSPVMSTVGGIFADKIGSGIQTAASLLPKLISGFSSAKSVAGGLIAGFSPLTPLFKSFGAAMQGVGRGIASGILPAVQSIVGTIQRTLPAVLPLVQQVAVGIGSAIAGAIPAIAGFVDKIGAGMARAAPVIGSLLAGFAPLIPQLEQFGSSVSGTIQTVLQAALPAVAGIIQTVQTVLPSVLPVIQTVVGTIGSVLAQGAPLISSLVQGIGTVVSKLAPVFHTIFTGIGQKVGDVIGFVSGKMGFIQNVIQTVAPIVSDVLSTAWGVISPIMDIAINVFKLIFNVVQRVFPGIQKIIQTVWSVIKPIVEGIGGVLKTVGNGIGWIAGKFSGGDGGGKKPGRNAKGTNNWRGGPTWVGEHGPELAELPRGTKILPNKESVSFARRALSPQEIPMPVPQPPRGTGGQIVQHVALAIAKLADTIVVREEADIDKIGEAVSRKVVQAVKNLVPA